MDLDLVDVKSQYDKDKDLRKSDVDTFMDWINKQPHLPKINEVQAILFLQSCYYSNEAAKTAIDTYFTVKTLCPELFRGRNPLESPLKENLNVTLFTVLPKQTPEGYSIIFMKLMDPNPDNYNLIMQLKYFDMITIRCLHQEGMAKGHLIVVDMKDFVFGHLAKFGPITLKKFFYYLQEGMPLRLKNFHLFNVGPIVDKILFIVKPFMKKELINMLNLHDTVDDLFKYVPKECLPQDYGGSVDATPILHEKVKQKLVDNLAFFEWEDTLAVEESKRPGKPKNVSDILGIEGTFKKLEID